MESNRNRDQEVISSNSWI